MATELTPVADARERVARATAELAAAYEAWEEALEEDAAMDDYAAVDGLSQQPS